MRHFIQRHRYAVALGGILLLALLLRLSNIGAEPYWADEIVSLQAMRQFPTAAAMLRYLALTELHPPLYYLMGRGWMAVFGHQEAAMRALTLPFSLGIVWLGALLGERLFSRRAGLLAALVLALLPMQIEYGQEARPYAIFCFFGALAMLACWERLRGGRWWWAAGYAAASAAGMYLHYSYAFVLAGTATWWLLAAARSQKGTRLRALLEWLVVHAAVAVAFFPWLTYPLYRILLSSTSITGLPVAAFSVRESDLAVKVMDALVWMSKEPYQSTLLIEVKLLTVTLFALAAAFAARLHMATGAAMAARKVRAVAYCGWMIAVPLIAFVLSPQGLPYAHALERHVILLTVPIALLLGALIAALPLRAGAVLLLVLFASCFPYLVTVLGNDYDWDPHHRVNEAAAFIQANALPGDLIIATSPEERVALLYYLQTDVPVVTLRPIFSNGNDVPNNPAVLGLLENDAQTRSTELNGIFLTAKMARLIDKYHPKRIWTYTIPDIDNAQKLWLQDHHWKRAVQPVYGLFTVSMFVAPDEPAPAAAPAPNRGAVKKP